jgi:hypothetical protein
MLFSRCQQNILRCVSKGKASPLTAKLKCPHERGKAFIESEAITEVARDGFGGGRKDHLGGGRGEDRCVLPAPFKAAGRTKLIA